MAAEGDQVEVVPDYCGDHACPAFVARNRHSIDHRFGDVRKACHLSSDLDGGYVFAFPSKRVADAIDEVEEAALVLAHQIAAAVPGVSLCEHVAQDLFFGGRFVRIAFEAAAPARRVSDYLTDRLANFVGRTTDAVTVFGAQWSLRIMIELDQRNRKSLPKKRRNLADRANFALAVEQRKIGLGRRVELENLRNVEPAL